MPTYPPVDEFLDRLRGAGWSIGDHGTATRWVFSGSNGENPDLVGGRLPCRGVAPGVQAGGGSGDVGAGAAGAVGGGGTTFAARDTDHHVGFGPHSGLTLGRRLDGTGLSLVGQVDGALELGRIRQGFFEEGTAVGGRPVAGQSHVSSSQAVPMLNAQLGVGWQPQGYQNLRFFAGHQYEYWWNGGRLSIAPNSRGELSDQGVVLQAEYTL